MSEIINEILFEYTKQVTDTLKDKLSKIILYGSYARGDFHPNSDLDIMILVKNINDDEIRQIEEQLCDLAFEMELKNGYHISAFVKNEEHFVTWQNILPFYMNVKNEGVEIHAI